MSDKDTIGAGIIGLGVRGFYCIGMNVAQTCQETGFRVTALCDRNTARMAEVRDLLVGTYAGHGVRIAPNLYESGLDLIDAPEVDLIVITSITDTHRQCAVPALLSGQKVYCDKPLAQNVEDAVAIVKAQAQANNPLIMGVTRRYEAAWKKAHALLADGVIGDLTMIQIRDVIPYHRYLTAWWRRREWSGGRSAVQPDPSAPPRCSLCDRECPYRRRSGEGSTPDIIPHFGRSWLEEGKEKYMDDVCVYAPGRGASS